MGCDVAQRLLGQPDFLEQPNRVEAPELRRQTPSEVIAKIGAAVDKVLATPVVGERLAQAGLESTRAVGSEGLELLIRTESQRWAEVVKGANIKAD